MTAAKLASLHALLRRQGPTCAAGRSVRSHADPFRSSLALAILCVLSAPAVAIEVDGRIDPAEWQGAQHVTDFRITQPLTGAPASQPTEAWILATPEGLAIGFRNTQPGERPAQRASSIRRDEQAQVDRVNLMIDFDGDGRTGYNFMVTSTDGINDAVITNENRFNTDWDGNWQHAASEDDDGWSAEMLIPWYIAPMGKGADGKRTFRIYLDRVIGGTGERIGVAGGELRAPALPVRLHADRGAASTTSRCSRSRRTCPACTTTSAATAASMPAPTSSGSPTASSS